jgi:hypothetical protein
LSKHRIVILKLRFVIFAVAFLVIQVIARHHDIPDPDITAPGYINKNKSLDSHSWKDKPLENDPPSPPVLTTVDPYGPQLPSHNQETETEDQMQTVAQDGTNKQSNNQTRTSFPNKRYFHTNEDKNIHSQTKLNREVSNNHIHKEIMERDVTEEQVRLHKVTSPIMVTSKENPNKISINVFNQQNIISKRTTPKDNNKVVPIKESNKDDVTKKLEMTQNKCCRKIQFTSTAETQKLYPFVLGIYELIDDVKTVYKKQGQVRFISRPQGVTSKGVNTFSWGVNSNPKGKWGWIKAFSAGDCPHLISKWRAYDKARKTWVSDSTLVMQCVQ